jgi:hypothetical protein
VPADWERPATDVLQSKAVYWLAGQPDRLTVRLRLGEARLLDDAHDESVTTADGKLVSSKRQIGGLPARQIDSWSVYEIEGSMHVAIHARRLLIRAGGKTHELTTTWPANEEARAAPVIDRLFATLHAVQCR